MAKICLIYFDMHTGYYPSFNHGLAYLIGTLKNNNQQVLFRHLKDETDFDKTINLIKKEKPDLIGLSFTTNQKKYVSHFLSKTELSAKLVIAGGVHCALVKEKLFDEFPQINGICVGEGELPFKELCQRIDNNEDYLTVPSFIFKTDTGIVKNPVMPLQEINGIALPDYSLFEYKKIIADNGNCFPMMLSRGCVYDCHYCCNHVFKNLYPNRDKYVRYPSVSHACRIIKNNLTLCHGTKRIIFADDTFTVNKGWLKEFLDIYKKEIKLPFLCNARIETIDDDILRCLKDAGCISIDFGVESGNEWLREFVLNRKYSNEKVKEVFKLTKKYKIKRFSYNMVGIPFETQMMLKETFELNKTIRPDFGKCFYFYPFPGTKLYQLCVNYGLLQEDYDLVSSYLKKTSIKEIHVTHKEIKKYFELMQLYFYVRIVSSKIKILKPFEKIINLIMFMFRTPFYILLDPTSENKIIVRFRKFIRKLAIKHLRYKTIEGKHHVKIVVNALSAQFGAGVSCFVNLLKNLDKVDNKNKYTVIVSRNQKEIVDSIPANFEKVILSFNSRNLILRTLFEQICLPVWLFVNKINLLYSVGNITTIFAPCKIVLLIENANAFGKLNINFSLYIKVRLKLIEILSRLSSIRADKIRFVSMNSMQIICKMLNIPELKTVVISQGVHTRNKELLSTTVSDNYENKSLSDRKYILTVANLYPYKKIDSLMKAYELLVSKYHYNGILQIVGPYPEKNYFKSLLDLKNSMVNGDKVFFTGQVLHNELEYYYKNADLFVFPSIEETFGVPLIEAMAYGVPVAASDCSSLPGTTYFNPCREICGDAAEYFNPCDIDNMADIMYKIISNNKLKNTLINNGLERVKKFDWKIVAQQLVDVFNNIGK